MEKYVTVFTVALLPTFWILCNGEGTSLHRTQPVVKRSLNCNENEMFVECSHCGPETCKDLGHPIPCGGATARCVPQCVCIDGLVRNDDGVCIHKKDCPDCGGDRNATSGCGNHCGRSCSDYKDKDKDCLTGCRGNSCDCKPDYVYHETLAKCVLPIDCL